MMSNPSDEKSNKESSSHCISFQDVLAASKRIQSIVHKTPVLTSSSINALCDDRNLFFKVEAMQRTGSFKFRGACNATLHEVEKRCRGGNSGSNTSNSNTSNSNTSEKNSHGENNCERIHIVTHSSGNHAAAVALAASEVSKMLEKEGDQTNKNQTKIESTIVMPRNAPKIKVNGVKGFGGNIVAVDNTNEAREEMADVIVERENATFIHPSENELVIAGQGTVCLEMVEQVREILLKEYCFDHSDDDDNDHNDHNNVGLNTNLDAVIIPVGGGGLAAGNAISLRGLLGDKVKVCRKTKNKKKNMKKKPTNHVSS